MSTQRTSRPLSLSTHEPLSEADVSDEETMLEILVIGAEPTTDEEAQIANNLFITSERF